MTHTQSVSSFPSISPTSTTAKEEVVGGNTSKLNWIETRGDIEVDSLSATARHRLPLRILMMKGVEQFSSSIRSKGRRNAKRAPTPFFSFTAAGAEAAADDASRALQNLHPNSPHPEKKIY